MDLNEEYTRGNLIRAYDDSSITVNEAKHYTPIILDSNRTQAVPGLTLNNITTQIVTDFVTDLPLDEIECVLIGCGATQTPHPIQLIAAFGQLGIGCEVMTTPAACRTFNILSADQRKIIAILLI